MLHTIIFSALIFAMIVLLALPKVRSELNELRYFNMLAKHQNEIPFNIAANVQIADQDGYSLFIASRTRPIDFNPLATPEATKKLFEECIPHKRFAEPIRHILEYDPERYIFVGHQLVKVGQTAKKKPIFNVIFRFELTQKEDIYELLPQTEKKLIEALKNCSSKQQERIIEQLENQCKVAPDGKQLSERPWIEYLSQKYAKEHRAVPHPENTTSSKLGNNTTEEKTRQEAAPAKETPPKRAYMIEFSIQTNHRIKFMTLPYKGTLPKEPDGWEWKERRVNIQGIQRLYSAELLNAQNVDALPTWSVIESILTSMGYPQSSHKHAEPIRNYLDSFDHFPVPIFIVEADTAEQALPAIPATKWELNFNFEMDGQVPSFKAHLLVPMKLSDQQCTDYLSTS